MSYVVVALGLLATLGAGCSPDPVEPVTTEPWVEGGLPEYCDGRGGDDAQFWDLVHSSCRIAQDGDLAQAEALRKSLEEVPEERVADFHRTFVRLNRGLVVGDLRADYRSWVLAHGQAAYEAVVADPEALRDFPDAAVGCGLGEPYGATAYALYLERTGLSPDEADVPIIEGR